MKKGGGHTFFFSPFFHRTDSLWIPSQKSKQQGEKKFLNTRNVIWNHKLLHALTKIRGNYLPQKKIKKITH
jgi:hypothetical protein